MVKSLYIKNSTKSKKVENLWVEFLLFTLIYWHYPDSIKHIIQGVQNSFGIDKAFIGFLLLEKVQTFLTPYKAIYRFAQHISQTFSFSRLSNSTKKTNKRLKIETLKWYIAVSAHSKTIPQKTACIQMKFDMKKKRSSLCIFIGIVCSDIGHCCCCQHLSIVCSFKIRWWKRGCHSATHTPTHTYIAT